MKTPLLIANIAMILVCNALIAAGIIGIGNQPYQQFLSIVLAQLLGGLMAAKIMIDLGRK